MVPEALLRSALERTIDRTDLSGVGVLHRGKVRDSYVLGERRTLVASDRISAFDVPLGTIPFKGQVLNGIAAHWFRLSQSVAPNHLIAIPDPNVSVVAECRVFPVEMVVRGYLTGSSPTSIWTAYQQGKREYCGHRLQEGMVQHQRLPAPLITPTTKAPMGEHDELTDRQALIARGVVSADEFQQMSDMCLALFEFGTRAAAERGLILVDTKYELGRAPDGRIVFVDEIHTPDSSRYWYADGYEQSQQAGDDPRPLDKDFVRRHLQTLGYHGEGRPPELSDELRIDVARRYIELFECVTGVGFDPDVEEPLPRIQRNLAA